MLAYLSAILKVMYMAFKIQEGQFFIVLVVLLQLVIFCHFHYKEPQEFFSFWRCLSEDLE